jgi:uncharacterized protein
MSQETVRATARRIASHAINNHLRRITVTLHGGEPLLAGHSQLRQIVHELRAATDGMTKLDINLQTNGVLLDHECATFLLDEQIRVGISLDGGRLANDRHRRFPHGGSSYERVSAAVELMSSARFRPIFAGILATIDPRNDPVALFRDLESMNPGRLDLLLPHATWDNPPPLAQIGRTVYGDWLITLFNTWYDAPPVIGVRLFQEIMHALLGGVSTSEAVGLTPPESIFIETDGTYELSDALKVTYPGAAAIGRNVFEHSIDAALEYSNKVSHEAEREHLSESCLSCPILIACGGGLHPHRYRSTNGFRNPSVYCHDLSALITHISQRITNDLKRLRKHNQLIL